jgi:UDP-GlcNAc:undecaprenyl-phosphate/decaprenyl-phosphate GlcNAc-1-phosphate transferase
MDVAIFLVAFGASTTVTGIIRALALRLRWISQPAPNRLRVAPTPIWGGIAIWISLLSAAAIRGTLIDRTVVILLSAATGAFVLGLADDLWSLRPKWKLLGQLTLSLAYLTFVPSVALTGVRPLDLLISLLWLVGISNAFNLLDNMNGLCAGTAVLVAGFQSVLFFFRGDIPLALLCLALVGATLGFLLYNFPAGRIFMGDSGSQFLGFGLAAVTLSGLHFSTKNQLGSLLFPLMLMVVPICDTTLVTLTRRIRRRPISVGGTDHLSHRLVAYGFSERGAVITLWTLSFLGGLVALLTAVYGVSHFITTVTLLSVSIAVLGAYLTRYELYSHADGSQRTLPLRFPMWLGVSMGILFDVILIVAAYYTAYLLRFDGSFKSAEMRLFFSSMMELLFIKLCVFLVLGSYRRWWQYFGLRDAFRLGWASVLASLGAIAYFSIGYRFNGFSRVVFILDFLVFTLLALTFRFSFRLFDSFAPGNHKTNVLIYGADDEGESALHLVTKRYSLRVIGFLDGDQAKKNILIHSVPVLGGLQDLRRLVNRWNVQAVLLTPSATVDLQNHLQSKCQGLGIGLKRLHLELEDLEKAADSSAVMELVSKEPVLANAGSESSSRLHALGD